MLERLKARLQHLLPHHLLTAVVGHAARWRFRPWSQLFIRAYRWCYRIDMSDAATPNLSRYPDFNAFFTRPLRPGARPWPEDESVVPSPVDGTISAIGAVEAGRMLQAKGQTYRLGELLGDDAAAGEFDGGSFVTLYLAPGDYHRVHMPLDAELAETRHLPGKLFSVAPFTVREVPRLFCRNERLACRFCTTAGQMMQVLVGAMVVGGIETVWHGPHGHPARPSRERFLPGQVRLQRGQEMGWFAMGSTVILVFEPGAVVWREGLLPGDRVRLGQTLGRLASP